MELDAGAFRVGVRGRGEERQRGERDDPNARRAGGTNVEHDQNWTVRAGAREDREARTRARGRSLSPGLARGVERA